MEHILPLQKAVERAGGQIALARSLGIKQQTIWWWLNRSKKVPAERCAAIEHATGISRYELRPDVFGPSPERNTHRHSHPADAGVSPAFELDLVRGS